MSVAFLAILVIAAAVFDEMILGIKQALASPTPSTPLSFDPGATIPSPSPPLMTKSYVEPLQPSDDTVFRLWVKEDGLLHVHRELAGLPRCRFGVRAHPGNAIGASEACRHERVRSGGFSHGDGA